MQISKLMLSNKFDNDRFNDEFFKIMTYSNLCKIHITEKRLIFGTVGGVFLRGTSMCILMENFTSPKNSTHIIKKTSW